MTAARRLRLWSIRILVALLAVLLLAVIGLVAWAKTGVRQAEQAPLQAVHARSGISVEEDDTAIVLRPDGADATGTGLVFFPGGKVEPAAYAARLLDLAADEQITVVIAKPYLGMALLDPRGLDTFTELAGEREMWIVGGHSLGGVRACLLAEEADALVLMASYCANDLSSAQLPVLSIAGSEDGLSTPQQIADARGKLPPDAWMIEIPGAAHASFGDYGPQDGDGTAQIDDAAMTAHITEHVAELTTLLRVGR